jgi:primosomal protein N'
MIRILVLDRDPGRASRSAWKVAEAVRREGGRRLIVAGPGPAPVERLKDRHRQQVLVRSAGRRRLVEMVDAALESVEGEVPPASLVVDVDPYSLL